MYRALGVALDPHADDPAGPGEAYPTMSKSERPHDGDVPTDREPAEAYGEAFARLAAVEMDRSGEAVREALDVDPCEVRTAPEATIREARAALDEARAALDEIEAAHPAAEVVDGEL